MAKNQISKKVETKKDNKKSFFKNFKAELKKVIWPTRKQVTNNTIAVIAIVLITAVTVFAIDFVFEAITQKGLSSLVQTINSKSEDKDSEENNESVNKEVEQEIDINNAAVDGNSTNDNTENE